MNAPDLEKFKTTIWEFYTLHGRTFEWRHVNDPYKVVVSEIMLQQTQTQRVAQKFTLFLDRFPNFATLATASLREVLTYWQGLGYNRRGKYLHEIAQTITAQHSGLLPDDPELLQTLPGIGCATASSICAFAFNKPTVFIETNIRTVFIHFFFKNEINVKDCDLLPLIAATVDAKKPRDWYYALMDYGVMLKKTCINPSRKSAHHTKQSKFEGSDRQIRGMIIKLLTEFPALTFEHLTHYITREPERIIHALKQLIEENIIVQNKQFFEIKN